jgi:alanyl-tRNA synthetase
VEIWNLVFTQFNRVGPPPDNLSPLPSRNIDTGMGLERTCAMLQGVDSNFHIDILRPLVEAVAEVCGKRYEPADDDGRRMRRIADHVRACTFAIHENVLPGNNEEKYVVKRLLRRAVLDGRQMGMQEPFLHKLPGTVAEMMRKPYPELADTVDRVAGVIRREEESFLATIDGGLERIEKLFATTATEMVKGSDAAELYTTYGFPPELLETIAAERNIGFDWDGFRAAMEKHGQRSGAGSRVEVFTSGPLDALKQTMHGSEFVGYDTTEADGTIVGIIAQNRLCETFREVGHATPATVILDRTPFYGESGGQVGDTGWLQTPTGRFQVIDTHREGGFVRHIGHLVSGALDLGQPAHASVDANRRAALRRAHSGTHLLHAALQHFLGSHAVQQGSKVDADMLRFDFSHGEAVGHETLEKIESMVNASVLAAVPVSAQLLPLAEARHAGAMMLFGEKYPDIVRMVSMDGISRELCGGTHVTSTGQIGLVRIVGEESVSAGTRRISAVTGLEALARLRRAEQTLAESAAALKVPAGELPQRLATIQKELKTLKKAKPAAATGGSPDQLLATAVAVGDTKVVVAEAPGSDAGAMRQCIDHLRRKASPIAVLLAASDDEGKVTLVAGISRELEARGLSAGTWIREPATIVGGKGGGRPDMAQAGGKLVDKLPAALDSARQTIEAMLRG